MPPPLLVTFAGLASGPWRIDRLEAVRGEGLPPAAALGFGPAAPAGALWSLKGVVSHPRYATTAEMRTLAGVQQGLGRPEAACAALIPIRKSDAWWSLAQDERRAVFEERSRHTARSLRTLPAVARRLHHARDLGEPFDFLTWFEFAPEHAPLFEELVAELRATEEWSFVEREVDIRLTRAVGQ
ncbi:MAG: chlorite dismutase family protein [Hyphomicrobiaceae bacterium]|nr:chlorite dismutase family protein [Hyphomicrobiaceae bacterium]